MHKQNELTLTELAPGPFYSNTNVHLVDINVSAKSDEIPSLPVQEKRKNQNVVDKELQKAITLTELAHSPYFFYYKCSSCRYKFMCLPNFMKFCHWLFKVLKNQNVVDGRTT